MTLLLYRLFLLLFYTGIRIVSVGNLKAKQWVNGRKVSPGVDYSKEKEGVVWMHCASLGEFEQGRPLIEHIKMSNPACKIVISFFSASGFEMMKNFKGADYIFYLPKDSAVNARKLIKKINPALVLWIKYEYWYYYLNELAQKHIPVLLVAGVYRSNMPFFKWYGALWKKMLACFTHFFVQNQSSATLLQKIVAAARITISGDTRFDRVIAIAEKFIPVQGMEEFCGNYPVIVAGSTWEDDEAEWVHYVKTHPDIRFIIAPHQIDKENLANVKKQFPASVFYSAWLKVAQSLAQSPAGNNKFPVVNCLIIDNIGMLSRLYKSANICYVGGGFGSDGLHNILEAAVYGKPVLFGPQFQKNFEAIEMMEAGGAVSISSALELERILNQLLSNEAELKRRSEAARNYVYGKAGATETIMHFIKQNAFLPTGQTVLQKDPNPSSQS